MAVFTCSNRDNLEEYFWLSFKKSAEYLGITSLTGVHNLANKIELKAIVEFIKTADKAKYNKE